MKRSPATRAALVLVVLGLLAPAVPASARPTSYRPGFNLFSPQQDVEIGRQSAAEAERQLPMLRDRAVDRHLEAIVRRLAARAPGERYPYQVQAVNAADVNAFALPGGFLYVNRGTIEAASNEAELAGVLAHEIAHVALRHGTHQASRAYLARAGLSVLGGALGGRQDRGAGEVLSAVGGLGLNALFLRYSREAETQADVVGAQIMAASGYDPERMATMFDKLAAMQRSQPGKLARFFSDHPPPANRAARIRQEAREIGPVSRSADVGGFERVRASLGGRAPARGESVRLREDDSGRTRSTDVGPSARRTSRLEPPSTQLSRFRQRGGLFTVEYPADWQVFPAESGYGATLAPPAGVVRTADGRQGLVCGVVLNHYDPFDERHAGGPLSLAQATDDLVEQVQRGNSYLRAESSPQPTSLDGRRARTVRLSGRSPLTAEREEVTIYTRELDDGHVLYALLVVPGSASRTFEAAFSRMIDSLQVDDRAAHR